MEPFQSRGCLIAGVSFDIPGMGYRDPQTGAIKGFEPDLARAVAEKLLGSPDRVDFVQVTNETRLPAVQHDLADMVLSQITITPDRVEQVDFSTPYHVTREAILVPRGSGIRRFEHLEGKRIAVTAGSISMRRIRPTLPAAKLIVTPLNAGCLETVAKDEADAASNDLVNLTLMRMSSGRPDQYEIIDIGDKFEPKPYGIAVKKGNLSLLGLLNGAIESLKADNEIERLLAEAIAGVGSAIASVC